MGPSPGNWQETFDADFPNGLILRWDGDPSTRYVIPRVEVLGEPLDRPVVRLDTFETQKSIVAQVAGYTVVRRNPTLARVVGLGLARMMIWDAALPQPLIEAMAGDRD